MRSYNLGQETHRVQQHDDYSAPSRAPGKSTLTDGLSRSDYAARAGQVSRIGRALRPNERIRRVISQGQEPDVALNHLRGELGRILGEKDVLSEADALLALLRTGGWEGGSLHVPVVEHGDKADFSGIAELRLNVLGTAGKGEADVTTSTGSSNASGTATSDSVEGGISIGPASAKRSSSTSDHEDRGASAGTTEQQTMPVRMMHAGLYVQLHGVLHTGGVRHGGMERMRDQYEEAEGNVERDVPVSLAPAYLGIVLLQERG